MYKSGTGTLGRVCGDLGIGDARRKTWGHQVWDAGMCGTGTPDVKYRDVGDVNDYCNICNISHFPHEYVLVNAAHPTLLMVPIF